ncbi:glycoside hydrolase family 130 protein [Sphingomonas prati]|uniref:Putative GH43/DUF377 family glycosyl hydrolase n=1 Tax=Sphingomonas prati TaxID=1843237 RepID=A0A7W9BQW9_9SPHN|nr:glycoside hydrolase family 130 protein [Sphingomonas prati]MBB5728442.1 putative GH43/DUF377 family glycosyl hydrolase [Sphingomonas prati]
MSGTDIMTHSSVQLHPDPSRTVLRPFDVGDPDGFGDPDRSRAQRIVDHILRLDEDERRIELDRVLASLHSRHMGVEDVLFRRFEEISGLTIDRAATPRDTALLIGAYFSEEYSFEAAALFNPSVILHPDQSGLPDNTIRFVLSLRGIGEGHVSSVTFRTGTWAPGGEVVIDPPRPTVVSPRIESIDGDIANGAVCFRWPDGTDPSERVLFPITPSQRQGIEDLRLVRFTDDDGSVQILGTYTAFNGASARSEMLSSDGTEMFEIRPLNGSAGVAKGMALFPRKIDGRYVMLGRQDNANIWLLTSDNLYHWEGGQKIITPENPWEYIQMGNCGSPIELDEGWLVLTHGVGTVRTYCIGACLLDRHDPTRVIGRMRLPLVHPSPKERDGYVPNVVYSCGALVHDRTLLLPYGVSDNFATFATVPIDDLLATMI